MTEVRNCDADGVIQSMTAHHIALVFHDFSTGGSERIAIRLANQWAASGRRVTIFCGTEGGSARDLVSPAIEIVSCKPAIHRGWGSRILLGWKLANLFARYTPDVVFAPGNFHLMVLAVAARRVTTKRPIFVCKISNPLIDRNLPSILRALLSWLLRPLLAPIDKMTAMSPLLAKEAQLVLPNRQLTCIDEPILDARCNAFRSTALREHDPLILCIGRLERQKDFELALRAFAELSPLGRTRLAILGEGPDRQRLLDIAQRLGIAARVDLPGHVPNVSDWIGRARLMLMTSRYEGFPAVLIEARALGLPVVTTDCSAALPEVILAPCHGEVVHSRVPFDIAGAIRRQLETIPGSLEEIARGTERFQIQSIAPQWLHLFDSAAVR